LQVSFKQLFRIKPTAAVFVRFFGFWSALLASLRSSSLELSSPSLLQPVGSGQEMVINGLWQYHHSTEPLCHEQISWDLVVSSSPGQSD